jgi:hypothetical protein
MSGHRRFCAAAALLAAGLSPSPASSNPFADLFNFASGEAPAPAPAKEECLPRPGKSTAHGQHWVYRLDGHRKCWFQAAVGPASAEQRVYHHAAKKTVVAPEENEAALSRPKPVGDARAQLLRSAPAETFQPTPLAPELKVVDAAAVPTNGAAALLLPPVPAVAEPTIDRLTSDHSASPPVDVEMLLAAAPSARDTVASAVPPVTPGALPIAGEDERGWMPTLAGVLLMVLGIVSLLGSALIGSPLGQGVGATRRRLSVRAKRTQRPVGRLSDLTV